MTGLHEEIAGLEAEVADLEDSAERCRKTMLLAKFAVTGGAILFGLALLEVLRFGPVALLASVTAMIGGTVLFGSSRSTRGELLSRIAELEERRSRMIDEVGPRTVCRSG